jgi:cephalosporin hydroxylase
VDHANTDTRLKHIHAEEYVGALQAHYPDLEWTRTATDLLATAPFDYGANNRYQKPTQRVNDGITGWITHSFGPRHYNISRIYKGLLCGKSPIDLWLYSACIYELKPRTVIELGAFQGGSALWLADQVTAMDLDCEVHSYEILHHAISARAKHPKLHFHPADLNDLASIDVVQLKAMPHPWLIIDDAHSNVLNTLSFFRQFMRDGDYFIKEDTDGLGTAGENAEYLALAENLGFYVDGVYVDGFGFNVTTARNTWFTLRSEGRPHTHGMTELRNITWSTDK